MRVGFIGLGNMGGPMAKHILDAGHALTVYDVRKEAASTHLQGGARWAESPMAVAAASDIVFTSLPGPKEVEAVTFGEGGILQGTASARGTPFDAVYDDRYEHREHAGWVSQRLAV